MKPITWRRDLLQIAVFALLVAMLAVTSRSGVVLNFTMTALYGCLMAQSWNLLGGFGGQFSFGHALFFGTGAYTSSMLVKVFDVTPWAGMALGGSLGGSVLGLSTAVIGRAAGAMLGRAVMDHPYLLAEADAKVFADPAAHAAFFSMREEADMLLGVYPEAPVGSAAEGAVCG